MWYTCVPFNRRRRWDSKSIRNSPGFFFILHLRNKRVYISYGGRKNVARVIIISHFASRGRCTPHRVCGGSVRGRRRVCKTEKSILQSGPPPPPPLLARSLPLVPPFTILPQLPRIQINIYIYNSVDICSGGPTRVCQPFERNALASIYKKTFVITRRVSGGVMYTPVFCTITSLPTSLR